MVKRLFIPKVALWPTLKCNLRCKLCTSYSPYYENPYHPQIEDLYRYADRIFEIADNVGDFIWAGGEPFLRKDMHLIVEYVLKYKDRINRIDVITNGSIVPSDDIVKSLDKYGEMVRIIVSDYGSNLSINVEEIAEKFRCTNAKIEIRSQKAEEMYCNGWVDYGISLNSINKGEKYAKTIFSKCNSAQKMKFCSRIIDGILFPCSPLWRCVELGLISLDQSEAVDLFDKKLTDNEIRKKIDAFYKADMLTACAYCNGMCDDSPRFTPAEQLSAEEIELLRK